MKKILILTITLLSGGLALPATARPHKLHVGHTDTYLSGHLSCGTPVYTKRVVIGFDCRHHPIYRYHRVNAHSAQRLHSSPASKGRSHCGKQHRSKPVYHRRTTHYPVRIAPQPVYRGWSISRR